MEPSDQLRTGIVVKCQSIDQTTLLSLFFNFWQMRPNHATEKTKSNRSVWTGFAIWQFLLFLSPIYHRQALWMGRKPYKAQGNQTIKRNGSPKIVHFLLGWFTCTDYGTFLEYCPHSYHSVSLFKPNDFDSHNSERDHHREKILLSFNQFLISPEPNKR